MSDATVHSTISAALLVAAEMHEHNAKAVQALPLPRAEYESLTRQVREMHERIKTGSLRIAEKQPAFSRPTSAVPLLVVIRDTIVARRGRDAASILRLAADSYDQRANNRQQSEQSRADSTKQAREARRFAEQLESGTVRIIGDQKKETEPCLSAPQN